MRLFWTIRISTALVWGGVTASAAYWGLLIAPPVSGLISADVDSQLPQELLDPSQLTSFLGAATTSDPNPPAIAAANPVRDRYTLVGVMTEGAGGAALISIDGQPARPYRVGWSLDDHTTLQSVGRRHSVLVRRVDDQAVQVIEVPLSPASLVPGSRGQAGLVSSR